MNSGLSDSVSEKYKALNHFIVVDKELLVKTGVAPAVLFAFLISMEGDTPGDWFSAGIDDVASVTTLSRHEQDGAIATLIDCGLIEKSIRGIPGRRHFRIIW